MPSRTAPGPKPGWARSAFAAVTPGARCAAMVRCSSSTRISSGTDYDIFYGLHSAVTRRTRDGEPPGGWYPEEAVTMEEALRAYTLWPARASGREALTGSLEVGKWADLTVLSIDPFAVGQRIRRSCWTGRL